MTTLFFLISYIEGSIKVMNWTKPSILIFRLLPALITAASNTRLYYWAFTNFRHLFESGPFWGSVNVALLGIEVVFFAIVFVERGKDLIEIIQDKVNKLDRLDNKKW